MSQTTYFAAGCFWGIEHAFQNTNGVTDTSVGYMGGHTDNPTYEDVCSKATGHAEVVEVVFDPEVISYESLVETFFGLHDPTQVDRQGPDIGDQYRSEIFCTSEEQKKIAAEVLKKAATNFSKPIATKISDAPTYFKGEDYHQSYVLKRRGA